MLEKRGKGRRSGLLKRRVIVSADLHLQRRTPDGLVFGGLAAKSDCGAGLIDHVVRFCRDKKTELIEPRHAVKPYLSVDNSELADIIELTFRRDRPCNVGI